MVDPDSRSTFSTEQSRYIANKTNRSSKVSRCRDTESLTFTDHGTCVSALAMLTGQELHTILPFCSLVQSTPDRLTSWPPGHLCVDVCNSSEINVRVVPQTDNTLRPKALKEDSKSEA